MLLISILLICSVRVTGEVEDYIKKYVEFISGVDDAFKERHNRNISYGTGQEFTCLEDLTPSPTVPLSVHALRPADIKVVAALGDSITAGFGEAATSIINLATEWRGRSWTIGAQYNMERLVTIPAILKNYNANLYGSATGNGGRTSSNAGYNVAISGAIAKGIPEQVTYLINKMKADSNIDYQNDWKLVSLWIGGNDLCAACNMNNDNTPEMYTSYIKQSLDELRDSMPRTFVNLIQIVDVTKLYYVQDGDCQTWHNLVCKCGTSTDPLVRDFVTEYAKEYQERLEKLAHDYDDISDFTVVTQPFWINTEIPEVSGKPDRSYFSIDCFHYTEKGHDAGAVALWKNMFEPVGSKSDKWSPGEKILCPTDTYPYLFTNHNSKGVVKAWARDHNITQI